MTLGDPVLLQVGVVLTVLLLVGLWSHNGRRRRLGEFLGGRRAVRRVARWNLYRHRAERVLLLGLGGLALALAAAEPRWTGTPVPEPAAKNVIIAVDVSASMQATDVQPTRLARAVDVSRELLSTLSEHRVGLLLFAGTGYPLAPPTFDHEALRFLLDGITPTIASQYDPGTLMSVGIQEGLALLQRPALLAAEEEGNPGERVIVVIGDGETGTDDPDVDAALEAASEADVTVHAVGIGTDEGSGMIMPSGTYQVGGPVLDASGGRAVAGFGGTLLESLATSGGGLYTHADLAPGLQSLLTDLAAPSDPVDAPLAEEPPVWAQSDIAYVLGLAALVFVLLESLLDVTLPRLRAFRAERAT